MTTTTSSSNRKSPMLHLYRSILRRYFGVALLYFLLQLLFFPLQYILTAANTLQILAREGAEAPITAFTGNGGIYNAVSGPVMLVMMIAIPILFPLMQMSFLHQKKSVDLYHALPIRRERLLLINFAASATMVLLPLLLNFLFVLAAGLGFGFSSFSVSGLFYELLLISVSALGILSVCYLTAVLSGTVFDNLLYAGGALFGLPLTLYVLYAQMGQLLYGFTDTGGLKRLFALLSPATYPVYCYLSGFFSDSYGSSAGLLHENRRLFLITALVWLLLSAALLLLSAELYRRRKSELAGQSGARNGLSLFLKMLGSLLGGVCLSMLLISVSNLERLFISVPAALVGGAITYCLIESILARGFRTLKKSILLIAAGALLPALAALAIGTGGLGYETRIPQADDIESVVLTNYRDRYGFARYDLEEMRAAFADTSAAALKRRSPAYDRELVLRQPESVAHIRRLHKALLEKKDTNGGRGQLLICYRLKNGRTITRWYLSLPEEIALLCDQIGSLEETKRQLHPLFTFEPADIREITLMNRLMAGITPVSLSEADTGKLIEALRADMLDEPYEQTVNPEVIGYIALTPRLDSRYWSSTNLRRADISLPAGETGFSDCYVAVTPRYTRTLALLGQLGYGSFTEVDFSDFETAYIRLEGFYSVAPDLTGPVNFLQATYREENDDANFYRSSYDTPISNPADIETLTGLIRYNPTESAVTLPYEEMKEKSLDEWNTHAALYLTLVSKNGDNLITPFYVRPCDVPQSILEQMRERFGHAWGEELFDWLLEKFSDPDSLVPASSASPAVRAETTEAHAYIQARF